MADRDRRKRPQATELARWRDHGFLGPVKNSPRQWGNPLPTPSPAVPEKHAASEPPAKAAAEAPASSQFERRLRELRKHVPLLKDAISAADPVRAIDASIEVSQHLSTVQDLAAASKQPEHERALTEIQQVADAVLREVPRPSTDAADQALRGSWELWDQEIGGWRAMHGTPSDAGTPAEIAASGTKGEGQPLPFQNKIQASFGHHDVSDVRAHIGGDAAHAASQLGANAFATGKHVGFASSPGLHTAAHEAAHTAQQQQGVQLEGGVDGGASDPHEQHADAVADLVVAGRSAEHLLDRPATGSAPAVTARGPTVQRKADQTAGAPVPDHKQAGTGGAGAQPSPDTAAPVAAQAEPPIVQAPHAKYPVFAETGQPYKIESPKDPVRFWVVRDWITAGAGFEKKSSTRANSPACATELLGALGWVRPDRIKSAAENLLFDISSRVAETEVAASAFYFTGMSSAKPVVSRASQNHVQLAIQLADPDVPANTLIKIDDDQRLAMIRALASYTGLDPVDDAVAKLAADQNFQTERVQSGVLLWDIGPATGDAIFGFDVDAKHGGRYSQWLHAKPDQKKPVDATANPKLKLDNYYHRPVPGELTIDRKLVEAETPVWLQVPVKWPSNYPSADEYDVVPMVTPGYGGNVSLLTCVWSIEPTDGSGAKTVTRETSLGELHHAFTLPEGRQSGTFKITVHAQFPEYFEPATFEIPSITVKSTAAAMQQLGDEAFGDLGAQQVARTPEHFDVRGSGDDKEGSRTSGQLPASFEPSALDAPDPRGAGRVADRKRLEAVRMYLQARDAKKDVLDAIDRELAASRATETALESDRTRGFQPFQIRGTYLSRTDGVPSGPLTLYGSVRTSEVRMEKGGFAKGGIVVQVRDLSRRFDNTDMMSTAVGATFEEALKAAFLDNAKAYPTGVIEIEAEAIDADVTDGKGEVGKPNGRTLGFQLGTDSTWKRAKEHVFSPIANVVTNLAAMALMAFVPGSAAVVAPLLIAYNTTPTLDRLRTESERGTLSFGTIALSVGEIALNLLPFAGKAKPFSRNWFVLETANWGGQAILMGASAVQAAHAIQTQDADALALLYEEMQKLETSKADPAAIDAKRLQVIERAKKVSDRIEEQITEQVTGFALIAAAGSVIHHAGTATQRARLMDDIHARQTGSGSAPHSPTEHSAGETPTPPHDDKTAARGPGNATHEGAGGSTEHQVPGTEHVEVKHPPEPHRSPPESAPASQPLGAGLGAEIARQVPATSYEPGGVFKMTVGDHQVAVTVRRTSGKARIIDEDMPEPGKPYVVVLEIPKGLDEAGLKAAVVEQLLTAREMHRARTTRVDDHPQLEKPTPEGGETAHAKHPTEKAVEGDATTEKTRNETGSREAPPKTADDDNKSRSEDGKQLAKPEREGVEEAITRRNQPVKPMNGARDEAWAGPNDRKGVPEDVALSRQEVRDIIKAKYKDTIAKFDQNKRKTADERFLPIIAELEKLAPGAAQTDEGKVQFELLWTQYHEIAEKIKAENGGHDPDEELRLLYVVVEKDYMKKVWLPQIAGLPVEQQAKLAHMWREEWKIYVRDMMGDNNSKEILYLRDRAIYGDRRGGRFDEFHTTNMGRAQGDSDAAHRATIDSAFKSNPAVNKRKTGYEDGIDAVKAEPIRNAAAARDAKTELPSVRAERQQAIDRERKARSPKVSDSTQVVGHGDEEATGAQRQEENVARRTEIHLADDKPAVPPSPKAATIRGELDALWKSREDLKKAERRNAPPTEMNVFKHEIARHEAALDAELKNPANKDDLLDPSVVFALSREHGVSNSTTLKSFLSSNIDGITAAQAQSRQGVNPALRAKREVFERELALTVLNDGPVKKGVDANLQMMCDKARNYVLKSRPEGPQRDAALARLGVEASGGYAGGVLTETAPGGNTTPTPEQNQTNGQTMLDVLNEGNARERMIALGKFAELVANDMQNDHAKFAAASEAKPDTVGADFTPADAKAFVDRLAQYNKDRGYHPGDRSNPTKKAPDTKDFLKPVSTETGPGGPQETYQQQKQQEMDAKLPGVFTDDAEEFLGRNLTAKESKDSSTGTTKGGESSPVSRTRMTVEEAQKMGLNLSKREIAAANAGKLPWIVGTTANIVDPQSQFIKSGTQGSMPQKAGISGTTFRFMEASQLLGGNASQSRLAMIGALEAIDAHTVYEIASAATGFGMPFDPKKPYANLGVPEPVLQGIAKRSGSTLDELNGTAPSADPATAPGPQK